MAKSEAKPRSRRYYIGYTEPDQQTVLWSWRYTGANQTNGDKSSDPRELHHSILPTSSSRLDIRSSSAKAFVIGGNYRTFPDLFAITG